VDVGEVAWGIGDRDVEKPLLGVALDLVLLAVQTGLCPGFHIPGEGMPNIPR
jgi:hypothetical protein